MALDRWIALVFLLVCAAYGYAAFFTMDATLPPFMKFNPVWPSTFPKILSILGAVTALVVLVGFEKRVDGARAPEINYRRLHEYKLGQALLLLGLMVAYALLLRPAGFLLSTFSFLVIGSLILGERRRIILMLVAGTATGIVWYLVQVVLGIFLSPLPAALG
ncbi:MAG: tripartite tricarboxylate transporter TctB family protein [Pseudomonadota bacterium]